MADLFTPKPFGSFADAVQGAHRCLSHVLEGTRAAATGSQSEAPLQDTEEASPVSFPQLLPTPFCHTFQSTLFHLQGHTCVLGKRDPTSPFLIHAVPLHFGWPAAGWSVCALPQALPLYIKHLPIYTPSPNAFPPHFLLDHPKEKGCVLNTPSYDKTPPNKKGFINQDIFSTRRTVSSM